MAHFILVHGMFHGGWCWDPLRDRLAAAGHIVQAPDLAGCGSDATPASEVSLARWAEDIAALARRAAEPVILVGHSRGGLVITQAAELASETIAATVYVTALLLPDGASARMLPQLLGAQGLEAPPPPMTMRLDPDRLLGLVPEEAAELFYGPSTPKDRAWAVPQLTPEPMAPLGQPLALSAGRWGRVPRIYVEATADRTIPIATQRAMAAQVGVAEVHRLDADHMPIITHVEPLAAILEDVAARYAPEVQRA